MSYVPVSNVPADSETPEPEWGPTPSRPTVPAMSQFFFDTTLDKPVWWDGAQWVDSDGTPA
jgi:hypothetical protein